MSAVTKGGASDGRSFVVRRNESDLAALGAVTDELLPLMRSARRNGDRATALLAANMIQARLESLSPGMRATTSVDRMLTDVSRIQRGLSRERSTTERLFSWSVKNTTNKVASVGKNAMSIANGNDAKEDSSNSGGRRAL